jgi:hypothetical protein
MVTCFGVNLSDRDGQNKAGIDLAFMDSAPSDVQAFKAVMEEWDRLLVQTAKANRAAWFRSEKVSDSIIDYLYCPCVRPNIRKSDGQRFADTMRPKIKRRTDNGTDKLGLDAFDDAGAPIDPLTIGPKSEVRVIVTQTGIWISESMFVCSFEAVQAQLLGKPQLAGFGFVDAHSAPSSPSEKESDIA